MKTLVFGPVPSRRLGFSLGVDLIPRKYCSFDCIYCQLGATAKTEVERQSFYEPALIVEQVVESVKEGARIDCISLSGSGEPTLNSDIGWVIERLKEKVSLPVAVITNGSLLSRKDVRKDLMLADIVLPSLDAASEAVYRQVNRPHDSLEFAGIVEGLKAFCKAYKGRIWLEVMLINKINNDEQHIEMFKRIVDSISVDKVQLNTVARPPAEKTAMPVAGTDLLSISRFFGDRCEVVAGKGQKQTARAGGEDWQESVLAMLRRRSLSLDDIVSATGVSISTARAGMKRLAEKEKVRAVVLGRRRFYVAAVDEGSYARGLPLTKR
jgi:wyosine [tRNA(Phe)-imidazoG37] synthetase (radical SAM superfamily)